MLHCYVHLVVRTVHLVSNSSYTTIHSQGTKRNITTLTLLLLVSELTDSSSNTTFRASQTPQRSATHPSELVGVVDDLQLLHDLEDDPGALHEPTGGGLGEQLRLLQRNDVLRRTAVTRPSAVGERNSGLMSELIDKHQSQNAACKCGN